MQRLELDCEELLNWWEPKSDISYIFRFNWRSLQQLREAVTLFLSARLNAMAQRASLAVSETGCNHLKSIIASNPETPSDMLEFLAGVSPPRVLVRIAENTNTASNTLGKLALSEDSEVRMAVAENHNSPQSCLELLVDDPSVDVRYRLAENPNAPITLLYKALKDENPYVSCRARKTLARILTNTISMSARLMADDSELRHDLLKDDPSRRFAARLMAELSETLGFEPDASSAAALTQEAGNSSGAGTTSGASNASPATSSL